MSILLLFCYFNITIVILSYVMLIILRFLLCVRLQNTRDWSLYLLDCAFSVGIVGTLVVFVWRGVWILIDIYLFPENSEYSAVGSLVNISLSHRRSTIISSFRSLIQLFSVIYICLLYYSRTLFTIRALTSVCTCRFFKDQISKFHILFYFF